MATRSRATRYPVSKERSSTKECNQVDALSCPCWSAETLPTPPANQCFNNLPDSLVAEVGIKEFSHYHLEVTRGLCYVKSADPAVRVDPTPITAALPNVDA